MSLLLLFSAGDTPPPPEPLVVEKPTGLFLGWGNLADASNLSGGGWRESLPLGNLKIRRRSRVARSISADPADTWFVIDLGASAIWRVLVLAGHNLSLDARYRVRAGDDPAFVAWDFDTGWLAAWPAVYDSDALEWEADNFWAGTYTRAQRQGLNWDIFVRPDGFLASRYQKVEIEDPLNEASYVQLARLIVADGWSPSRGMAYGAQSRIVDPSSIQTSDSGAESYGVRSRYREVTFNLNYLLEAEAYGRGFELQRGAGVTGEVVFIWSDADVEQALRRRFVGRLEEISAIDHPPVPGRNSIPFKVRETL